MKHSRVVFPLFVIVLLSKCVSAFAQTTPLRMSVDSLAYYGFEKLFFLATTDRSDFDYQLSTAAQSSGATRANGEYYIRAFDGTADGVAVTFRDTLDLDYLRRASDGSNEVVIDFIYRIDGAELSRSATSAGLHVSQDTTSLFQVRAALSSSNDANEVVSQNIGWRDYANRVTNPREVRSIAHFPMINMESYAVLPMRLRIPSGTEKRGSLKLQLSTNRTCGIYVRGFRIRSVIADEVLRGVCDSALVSGVSPAKSGAGESASNYSIVHFRVIAYLDWLRFKQSGVHPFANLMTQMSSLQDRKAKTQYRAIYEAQNGISPEYGEY